VAVAAALSGTALLLQQREERITTIHPQEICTRAGAGEAKNEGHPYLPRPVRASAVKPTTARWPAEATGKPARA